MRSCLCTGTFRVVDLLWLEQIRSTPKHKRIPVALTVAEVQSSRSRMAARPTHWMPCSTIEQFVSASQAHRNPTLPHPLFSLLHGVFTVMKDARSQHGIRPANAHAVGQVVEVAHTA